MLVVCVARSDIAADDQCQIALGEVSLERREVYILACEDGLLDTGNARIPRLRHRSRPDFYRLQFPKREALRDDRGANPISYEVGQAGREELVRSIERSRAVVREQHEAELVVRSRR